MYTGQKHNIAKSTAKMCNELEIRKNHSLIKAIDKFANDIVNNIF